jgi:hypothetical protein
MTLLYVVQAEFDDARVADEYLNWLTREGHVAHVVASGARVARVIQLGPTLLQVQYEFVDQTAYAAYEAGPAVGLRAEGRRRFSPERGVRFTRSIGSIVFTA